MSELNKYTQSSTAQHSTAQFFVLKLRPNQTHTRMGGNKKEMQVVKGLDLNRYMGRWYEIASFPSRFQPRDGQNTRATYRLNDDGTVHVLNETFSGGKRSYIEGTAYKADPKSDEAKFKVKFYLPPFLPIIPVVGNYWVLYIDEDYQYALIGEPTRKYLWVCTLKLRFCMFLQNCYMNLYQFQFVFCILFIDAYFICLVLDVWFYWDRITNGSIELFYCRFFVFILLKSEISLKKN